MFNVGCWMFASLPPSIFAFMNSDIAKGLSKAGVASAERHLFICIGPDCCPPQAGERVWDYVKQRVRDTGLKAMRTKAGCFRICTGGPWLVVYPEGIWYGQVDVARFERILQQHLLGGEPVREWIVARNSLGCGEASVGEAGQHGAQSGDAAR
jgi:(2Fe-2S) ferredoxin